jgi:hypothetical protein
VYSRLAACGGDDLSETNALDPRFNDKWGDTAKSNLTIARLAGFRHCQ